MKEKLNMKNLLLALSMLFVAVSFTSCSTGGDDAEFNYPEDEPAATGLCGEKWILSNLIGTTEEIEYLAYTFDIYGRGVAEEKKDGEIVTTKFTWKSYNIGSTSHMLVLDGNAITYYVVTDNKLRLSPGTGTVLEFVPESQYVDPDNGNDDEGGEETEK